ncbi:MAG: ImmA/IrrE family metallo-endopeptidase [Carnobacterium sp.]|uniref:ImmA/IrrE family metallo-endopeptidase n=1 Tax=Carnobacterium sp. TaxID=48221 RepID=UPI002FCC4809
MPIETDPIDSNMKIHEIVYKIMLEKDISLDDYSWSYIVDYIKGERNIKITPYLFEEVTNELVSGMIVKTPKRIGIYYNSRLPKGRQWFTICHEIIHALLHLDQSAPFQQLFETNDMPVSVEDRFIEDEANLGSSIIMAPDVIICHHMKSNVSFPKMAEIFEMTEPALFVRLKNFLILNCSLNEDVARHTVSAFRYSGDKSNFRLFLNGFGSNVEKNIYHIYENS